MVNALFKLDILFNHSLNRANHLKPSQILLPQIDVQITFMYSIIFITNMKMQWGDY